MKLKQRLTSICLVCCTLLTLSGCGKDKALDQYMQDMDTFSQKVTELVDTMNNLDTTSESSSSDILSCLDEMDAEFQWMAELEVPEQFASIEPLADEASSYMTESVSLYHEAFDNEYDGAKSEAALENYTRAMKRIEYISDLLQGIVPDDENVTVVADEEEPAATE